VSSVLGGEQQGAVLVHAKPTHFVRVSLAGFRPLSELYTALVYEFQGGGIPIAVGHQINVNDFPFPCRIIGWRLTSTEDTDVVVRLSRSTYAEHPVYANIADIGIAGYSKAEGDALLWDNVFERGDMLRANVINNTFAKALNLTLRVVRLSQ
jgi:hypothetical protein